MKHLFVPPVSGVFEKNRQDGFSRGDYGGRKGKGVDAKVQGLVHTKMIGGLGSLFVSMVAPPLSSAFRSPRFRLMRQAKAVDRLEEEEEVPLGLMPCGVESWMNAVMQIVLRLPLFRIILTLWAPQSYEPFRAFLEQYDIDRRANLSVSSASSSSLVCCLAKKLSAEMLSLKGGPRLWEIFRSILWSFASVRTSYSKKFSLNESCYLMEWKVEKGSVLSLIQSELLLHAPSHLLVFMEPFNSSYSPIPRQIFDARRGRYYDLQGFLERRGDGESVEFIAYVKVAGKTWYQCRNQRISKLQSIHLDIPLSSSCLFYYKKMRARF